MSDKDRAFDGDLLKAIQTKELIGVRGGAGEHRFLPIWMVVVDGRVFARSWSRLQRSWRTAFDEEGVRDIVRPVSVVTTIEFLPSVGNG